MKLSALGPADDPNRLAIVDFFPYSFEAVNQLSQSFIHEEKRFAYTTPKSCLEMEDPMKKYHADQSLHAGFWLETKKVLADRCVKCGGQKAKMSG